jgi:aminoglycoside phosphotransferase
MLRFSTCQVFDLLAARNARCHDLNFSARPFNRRSQAAIADR